MNSIFADYNSTTPVAPEVLNAMLPYFSDYFGNPSSSHSYGQKALRAVDNARLQVAHLIGSQVDEIFFTGSGTEANNMALIGLANFLKLKGNHIITTQTEHSSVYNTCRYLESCGFEVTYLGVDNNGILNPDDLRKAITAKTILVSVIFANNETGVLQKIKGLSSIAKDKKVCFHTDAVQATGKTPIDVNDLGIDLLSISGHKLYAPKGVGALFVKRGITLSPIIYGGGQERKLRSGTENVSAIVGLGKAAELSKLNLKINSEKLTSLRDLFEAKIVTAFPEAKINGKSSPRIANTSNISFIGTDNETVLVKLDLSGICVSSGSACASAALEPSRILKAMNLTETEQRSSIRFSFGLQTTTQEIDSIIETLKEILAS